MEKLISILGLFILLAIPYALSTNRKKINKKLVINGLLLQLVFAVLILGVPSLGFEGPLRPLFSSINTLFLALLDFTNEGSRFLFGPLLDMEKTGFVLALQVLPTIIFFSSFISIAYHLGIIQKLVGLMAKLVLKTMGTSGAESLSMSANIFVGQTEAPLIVRPYINKMTQSELLSVMIGGMATVAGGVMALYIGLLKDLIPDIAGHLLTASILSAPAALIIAKIMIPETDTPETLGKLPKSTSESSANVIDAAARGAAEGLKLALNVGAMLLAFIALIAMLNAGLGWAGDFVGLPHLSFEWLLSWVFAPLAWIMGIPWSEALLAGTFLGEKVVINEFIAYQHMATTATQLSPRTLIILSYALCGFANFSSIAIQIGGLGSIAPDRQSDIAKLGIKALIGGSLAAFMTATIAGILI